MSHSSIEAAARAMLSPATPTGFEGWLAVGYAAGYVGPPVCFTHDGMPSSEDEDEQFDVGDPCLHVLRLYADADEKAAVEANHSPSRWRASNRGLTSVEDEEPLQG